MDMDRDMEMPHPMAPLSAIQAGGTFSAADGDGWRKSRVHSMPTMDRPRANRFISPSLDTLDSIGTRTRWIVAHHDQKIKRKSIAGPVSVPNCSFIVLVCCATADSIPKTATMRASVDVGGSDKASKHDAL